VIGRGLLPLRREHHANKREQAGTRGRRRARIAARLAVLPRAGVQGLCSFGLGEAWSSWADLRVAGPKVRLSPGSSGIDRSHPSDTCRSRTGGWLRRSEPMCVPTSPPILGSFRWSGWSTARPSGGGRTSFGGGRPE
jgi:hypothetical protein